MMSFVKAASVAGVVLMGQSLGLGAATVELSLDGFVDLDAFEFDGSGVRDGEAFTFSFVVDADRIGSDGPDFFASTPMLNFAKSGLSLDFVEAGASIDLLTDIGEEPARFSYFVGGTLPDLFLEVTFDIGEPVDSSEESVLAALEGSMFSGVAFTFGGNTTGLGDCAGSLFCGVNLDGPVNARYIDTTMSTTMGPTPVPLPAGLWLLLTGLGLAAAPKLRRKG